MATIREVLYQYSKNISTRAIAQSYGLSRSTIAKYLQLAISHGYTPTISDDELHKIVIKIEASLYNLDKKSPAMTALLKHKDQIKSWLSESNMTHTQILRLLKVEGINVSARSVNRFIQKHFPKSPKYTIHLQTKPGQEGQVDFGYVGKMKNHNGLLRKTYAFVMTLSHSRHRYVEFSTSQGQLSWAQLHINAFQFFGGVPSRIILDNLKAGVIKSNIYDPTLNETYSELSRFYGFAIDPAKAYKPEHKGKVERSIRIVKEQLIAGVSYKNIEDANKASKIWCQDVISNRVCSSTGSKPIDVFNLEEKDLLISLPVDSFDMPQWSLCKVHKDHHFPVKGNFYSVPTKYIGEEISIRIGLKTISAYHKYKIIKTHPRNYKKGQWITDEKDYPEAALYHLAKTPDVCLESARSIGDATYKIIEKTIKPGTRIGLRKAQGILRLGEKYGEKRLELACLRAIFYDNYAYKTLSNILVNELDKKSEQSIKSKKIVNIEESAYVRKPDEYSSDMEVNYVS